MRRSCPRCPPHWKRDYFFYANGYVKDMDWWDASPFTVAQLPFHGMSTYPYPASEKFPDDAGSLDYQLNWNDRWDSGDAGAVVPVRLPADAFDAREDLPPSERQRQLHRDVPDAMRRGLQSSHDRRASAACYGNWSCCVPARSRWSSWLKRTSPDRAAESAAERVCGFRCGPSAGSARAQARCTGAARMRGGRSSVCRLR